jgi:AFG3 family protein
MAENNSGDNKQQNVPKPSRRPSINSGGGFQGWIVVALIIALVGFYFLQKTKVLKSVDQTQYEQMVLNHYVDKLTIIKNKDIVEVSLNKKGLEHYKSLFQDQQGQLLIQMGGPHFEMPINSSFSFEQELNDLQKDIPREERIHATSDERTSLMDFVMGPGLLILMFVGIYFMFFRMGGAGGPGGQIFNIGRSKATLFDGEAKVKITFNDVAGLDEAKEEIEEIVEVS